MGCDYSKRYIVISTVLAAKAHEAVIDIGMYCKGLNGIAARLQRAKLLDMSCKHSSLAGDKGTWPALRGCKAVKRGRVAIA